AVSVEYVQSYAGSFFILAVCYVATTTTGSFTLSLHDALPISREQSSMVGAGAGAAGRRALQTGLAASVCHRLHGGDRRGRGGLRAGSALGRCGGQGRKRDRKSVV